MTPEELYAALRQIQPRDYEIELRRYRKNRVRIAGITKAELAKRLKASPRTVAYWFSGKYQSNNPDDYVKIRRWAKEGGG